MDKQILELCLRAKATKPLTAKLSTAQKNTALLEAADALEAHNGEILAANALDLEAGRARGMHQGLMDRLALTENRIHQMAEGLRQVAALPDSIGEISDETVRPNSLKIARVRVPIGVVGIIYEARPNVTADAFALCFKTGNVALLKGGSDAIHSNKAIVKVLRESLSGTFGSVNASEYTGKEAASDSEAAMAAPGKPSFTTVPDSTPGKTNTAQICPLADALLLVESTDRESTADLMKAHGYVDVLIPRGSAGLIRSVVENATVPVIETGAGNCHIFVDETADFDMALSIIENAKTQRIGVCNACESLVVHSAIADRFLPLLAERLGGRLGPKEVELRGDARACAAVSPNGSAMSAKDACSPVLPAGGQNHSEPSGSSPARMLPASDDDWGREYLDYILSVKVVDSIDEAIAHINRYNTAHSEAIITQDEKNAEKFLSEIDAAAVYVNASTRFTDGFEFGFGAEIGISTQKLHARGPMGLRELTCQKYIIWGSGQVRG